MKLRPFAIAVATAALAACSTGGVGAVSCSLPVPQKQASAPGSAERVPIGQLPDIDVDAVLAHIKVLSSDEFEGRAPGTKGEERSHHAIARRQPAVQRLHHGAEILLQTRRLRGGNGERVRSRARVETERP